MVEDKEMYEGFEVRLDHSSATKQGIARLDTSVPEKKAIVIDAVAHELLSRRPEYLKFLYALMSGTKIDEVIQENAPLDVNQIITAVRGYLRANGYPI